MNKQTYSFSARYQDVDFRRILAENPDADFIKVEYPREDGSRDSLVLLSRTGVDRMVEACVRPFSSYRSGIKLIASGGWRDGDDATGPTVHIIEDGSKFDEMFAKLRERECRKRKITVTAIR